jgi:uncharacterized protein YbcV (DUF1398 family)
MFTIDQFNSAHSKVKSGADYPNYVQEIIRLGVSGYETWVEDGRTIYFGSENDHLESGAKYEQIPINVQSDKYQFQADLKAHQEGRTNYPGFCRDAARSGVEKWVVDMSAMTCTYLDKKGKILVVETIPAP